MDRATTYGAAALRLRVAGHGDILGEAPLARFAGGIDAGSLSPKASHISAWAFDYLHPYIKPLLAIRVDGREVARIRASLFRPDLKHNGYGDGFAGFEIDKRLLGDARDFEVVELVSALPVLTASLQTT